MPDLIGHLKQTDMFTLIDLPYAPDALAPAISAQTLSFHHGKHLRGYVDTLNKLLPGTPFEGKTLEEIVRTAPAGPIRNNAGQILNHNLYFTQFAAPGQAGGDAGASLPSAASPSLPSATTESLPAATTESLPAVTGNLLAQIAKQWGTLEAFRDEFVAKGVGLFGSGWVWLAADANGTLSILQCPGADNPVAHGLRPILTFDVWEHAYYLDWQNRRADHLKALWGILDWSVLEERYEAKL